MMRSLLSIECAVPVVSEKSSETVSQCTVLPLTCAEWGGDYVASF